MAEHTRAATPTLLVVGDGEVADALASIGAALGWSVAVVDDMAGVQQGLPAAEAVVVLSHHDGLDGPALAAALDSGAGYVGAMGSRRTQDRRRAWLAAQGISEQTQAVIHGPAGLDIGADAPGEIAVSIIAEIVGVRRGVTGGALRDRPGPIHPHLPPGEALCPGEPAR